MLNYIFMFSILHLVIFNIVLFLKTALINFYLQNLQLHLGLSCISAMFVSRQTDYFIFQTTFSTEWYVNRDDFRWLRILCLPRPQSAKALRYFDPSRMSHDQMLISRIFELFSSLSWPSWSNRKGLKMIWNKRNG